MNDTSKRLEKSIKFLIENHRARTQSEIAKKIGVSRPTLNMAMKGSRVPTLALMLDFCDYYPINFRWLRTGEGSMIRDDDTVLLQKIAELEEKISILESRNPLP